MRDMKDETIYVTGESRTSVENAITKTYGAFYVAFEINGRTGEIVEADCSGTLELTRSFVRRMFVGREYWRTIRNRGGNQEKILRILSEGPAGSLPRREKTFWPDPGKRTDLTDLPEHGMM